MREEGKEWGEDVNDVLFTILGPFWFVFFFYMQIVLRLLLTLSRFCSCSCTILSCFAPASLNLMHAHITEMVENPFVRYLDFCDTSSFLSVQE